MARILIVDDEPDTLQMLTQFVSNEGHSSVGVANGWEALLAIGDQNFDLILLDIMMPGLDGAKFLQILRRASKAGDTPVVIVTALDRDAAEERIGGAQVSGIVVKRERMFENLLAKVRAVLVYDPLTGNGRGGGGCCLLN